MPASQLNQLLEEAREDPELFHNLVFNPEEAIQDIDYLDRATKGRLVGMEPEDIIGGIVGEPPIGSELADCGWTVDCGYTCEHTSSAFDAGEQIRTQAAREFGRRRSFQPRFR